MIDPNQRWLVALLLAPMLLTAGCIGLPGDGGEEENATPEEANETMDVEDDGAEWMRENRTGSVSGSSAFFAEEGENESFTVSASTLMLNLSAENGELEMCIQEPGNESANESNGSAQEDCDENVTTEDGEASFEQQAPESGEWTVRLTAAEPSASDIDYELSIAQRAPQDAGNES